MKNNSTLGQRVVLFIIGCWWVAAVGMWWSRPVSIANINAKSIDHRIPINTAEATGLELLPGIGPGIARSVVEHRQTHGKFSDLSDVEDVRMIGPKVRMAIAPYVTLASD